MKPLPSYTDGREADWSLIPSHMIGGLRRYIECGIRPGGFLSAVLCNDLKEACAHADLMNRHRLFDYMAFLYNHAPPDCYGSPERFDAWIAHHGMRLPDTTGGS